MDAIVRKLRKDINFARKCSEEGEDIESMYLDALRSKKVVAFAVKALWGGR